MNDERPPRLSLRQGLWFLALFAAWNLGGLGGGLVNVRMPYLLQDRLGLDPVQIALYGQLVAIPGTFAVAFGVLRDRWSPFGRGDQGLIWLFVPIAVLATVLLAAGKIAYGLLLGVALAYGVAIQIAGLAISGTLATFGKRFSATARLSSLWLASGALMGALGQEAGGWLAGRTSFEGSAAVGAAVLSLVFLLALRPATGAFPPRGSAARGGEPFLRAGGRLLRDRDYLAALLFAVVWSFGPAYGTPLVLHVKNDLGLDEGQFAHFGSSQTLGAVPGSLLYAALALRWPVRRVLLAATVAVTPLVVLFLVARDPLETYAAGFTVSLVCGVGNAAVFDRVLRALPSGLEGSGLALQGTLVTLLGGFTDVWATGLYARSGYAATVWPTMAAASLLVLLALRAKGGPQGEAS